MRKNRRPRYDIQLELFRTSHVMPRWQTLPPEATQRAKQLLARLLEAHRAGLRAPQSEQEATDER